MNNRPEQYIAVEIDPDILAEYRSMVKGKQTGIEVRLRHIAIFYSKKPTGQIPRNKTSIIHPLLVGAIPPGYAVGEPKYRSATWSTTPKSRQNPTETGR